MKCKNCGTECNDDAKFCPTCGANVRIHAQSAAPVATEQQPVVYRYQETDAFKTIAQAQNATAEYQRAKDDAMMIRAEYEAEKKALKRMVTVGTIFGFLLVYYVVSWFGYYLGQAGVVSEVFVLAFLFLAALSGGCGLVGIWNWLKKSGFFFFGTAAIMAVLFVFVLMIAIFGGPFFYLSQRSKVRRLQFAADGADQNAAAAYAVIR